MAIGPRETQLANLWAAHPAVSQAMAGLRPVVLFPAARMARSAAIRLAEAGFRVLGFGDSDASRWGSQMEGLPIWSPREVAEQHGEATVFVASSLHDSDIRETLLRHGCRSVVPMPVLNYLLPECFPCREYDGALEAVTSWEGQSGIATLGRSLADETSRRVLSEKVGYLATLEKERLHAVASSGSTYFDAELIALIPGEVFVDGGAFEGDTYAQFRVASDNCFKAYFAFEPDLGNYARMQQLTTGEGTRLSLVPAGLADHSGLLSFEGGASCDSHLSATPAPPSGHATIQVYSLDDFFALRPPPTFIKMDIEGAEARALLGAQGLIARDQPILAISVYHHPKDLWELPLLMQELNPTYELYLRHYTREVDGTVCYAIPPSRSAGSSRLPLFQPPLPAR